MTVGRRAMQFLFPFVVGCSIGAESGDTGDTSDSGLADAGGGSVDASIALDVGTTDAPEIDAAPSDGGPIDATPPGCGDRVIATDELCDSDTVVCTTLGGTWASGTAACRADCGGYDVSGCARAIAPALAEVVKPALRDPTRWSTARCNDGSPADFLVRLSATRTSHLWVIDLQGGAFCDDYSGSCAGRFQISSLMDADRATSSLLDSYGGILSPSAANNPRFADANVAWGHYCSSDAWSGSTSERRPSSGDPARGWYWSGRINAAAMFDALRQRYGLDDSDPSVEILLVGQSSGGTGVASVADLAARAFPDAAATGRLRLLIDAGWVPLWDDPSARWGVATTSDQDVMRRAYTTWGSALNPACEATVASAGGMAGDCFFGAFFYPALVAPAPRGLGLPTMIQQNALDPAYLGAHGVMSETNATALAWRSQIRTELASVDTLFSGASFMALGTGYHAITVIDTLWTWAPTGAPFADVVDRFASGGPGERVVVP